MARRREFDEDTTLELIASLFWERGYAATSMSEITARTGVGNGSIYAAYGSKPALFLRVFERYCRARVQVVSEAMECGADATEAVAALFDVVIEDCGSHRPSWGCLMLNTVAEVGRDWPDVVDTSSRTIREMETVVERRLTRQGLSEPDRRVVAREIVLVSQGLIQRSRVEQEPERLREIAASSLAHLAPSLQPA